ncbi:hypothetical protein VTO42DRAFT_1054 [Malbranchea cinnamomea]
MKVTTAILALAAAGSVSAAGGHRHRHHHVKRAPAATEIVTVPGPTVIAYELDGKIISKEEACEGIADGSLTWADGKAHPNACAPEFDGGQFFERPSSTSTPTPTPTPSTSIAEIPTTSVVQPSPSPEPEPEEPEEPESPSGGQGLDREFPDGKISCSDFPEEYGPLKLDYLGMGGWSGIQYVTQSGNAYSTIHTAIKGDKCRDGAMCSYACPPGYQKSQWPQIQGANGESVGGLECRNGKLWLTNPDLSKKLCIPGTGGVFVQNKLDEVVSVCRTDYPGTESEVVPLSADPGSVNPLTCPDAAEYYRWKGMDTSAQYYVNPKGVPTEEACQWGDGSRNIGNWAPVNLGVGRKDGATWISIFHNKPTTDADLDFNIKIVGDNLSGSCKYENGVYISETGSNKDGCTVQVMSGEATYVFY